jgi:hypothetical protein
MPHLIIEDMPPAWGQDFKQTGQGRKTADVELILHPRCLLPKMIRIEPGEIF